MDWRVIVGLGVAVAGGVAALGAKKQHQEKQDDSSAAREAQEAPSVVPSTSW